MHFAAQWGENHEAERNSGWSLNENVKMEWSKLTERVNNYIKSLNFGYRGELLAKEITYYNRLARIIGPH